VDGDNATLTEVSSGMSDLRAGIAALRAELAHDDIESAEKHAEHAQKGLLPAMELVRVASDLLETMIADDLWPLATYQEMLFIL
jgi:glutamine synthetase